MYSVCRVALVCISVKRLVLAVDVESRGIRCKWGTESNLIRPFYFTLKSTDLVVDVMTPERAIVFKGGIACPISHSSTW